MKEKCEEKIRIGKPNVEKQWHANEKSKPEEPVKSKTKSKSKNLLVQTESKVVAIQKNRPKSKSSCQLDTLDRTKGNTKIGNPEKQTDNKELEKEPLFLVSGKETASEKLKKNKSLDTVGKTSKNLSKTSLAKKVSNVLQQVRNPKTTSHIDLFRSNSKITITQNSPVSNILNNYSKLNLRGYNCDVKLQTFTDKQINAGKSLSFDSLKLFNETKYLSKCFSVENGKSNAPEKPIGVFNIHKKSYSQTPEAFLKKVEPLWSQKGFSNRQPVKCLEIFKGSGQIYESIAEKNSPHNKNLGCSKESVKRHDVKTALKSPKASYNALDPAKKYNDQSWQDVVPEKASVNICQCLHCHTEDGLKKICLHNNPASSEFGRKFFRVNYYSKKDDEDEDSDDKIEVVDKGTITDNTLIDAKDEYLKKLEFSKPRQKNLKFSVKKKFTSKPKSLSKIPKEQNYEKADKEVKKESRVVLWRNEKQMQILGQPSVSKKQNASPLKANKETKAKKETENKEEKKAGTSLVKHDVSREMFVQKKALEELEILEKLFLKLNSVEKLLLRHKLPSQQKAPEKSKEDKNLSAILSKKTKNNSESSKAKNYPECSDLMTEEEYLKRRNKLRNAVIRHVQDFLKLDFSFN